MYKRTIPRIPIKQANKQAIKDKTCEILITVGRNTLLTPSAPYKTSLK